MAKKKVEEPVVELEQPAGSGFAAFHEAAVPVSTPAIWELLPDGRYAASDGGVRDFRVHADGRWYEHVDETADGRWIYSVVR